MDPNTEAIFQELLHRSVGSLGTLHEGAPFVSMVPVALASDGAGFLIHVSRLAQHTRDLLAEARVSLMLMSPEAEDQDLLALPRLTLQGLAEAIPPGSAARDAAAEAYLARFPQAEGTLGLGDFSFFRIRPASGRLVVGFGRALSLDAIQIQGGLTQLTK